MPPSPTLAARDQRILAGYAAGSSLLDLAIAEEMDPAVVRRVLRAEHAVKSGLGRGDGGIARALGRPSYRGDEALRAVGIDPGLAGRDNRVEHFAQSIHWI